MSGSSTFRGRQSAVRIFAQEYSESSLIERGVGEYDPSFVITKLGAKVNRCLVCGGLERMERRDGDSGPFYSCLLYTSPSPRDKRQSRMPSSA